MKKWENLNILIVEDEFETRKNLAEFMDTVFGNVYQASNYLDFLKVFKSNKIDITLMDINLPGRNGLDIAKEVRKIDESVRIIMLTAHSEQELLLAAVELNLTRYLVKPVKRKDLKEALEKSVSEIDKKESANKEGALILGNGFIWEKVGKTLSSDGHIVKLTKYEIILMEFFCNHKNSVVSAAEIMEHIWEEYNKKHESNIRTLVKNLRKKLPEGMVENIYGMGYKLNILK